MTRVTIELTEDLRSKAAARAAESGHATIEEYVQDLLRVDAARPAIDATLAARLQPQDRAHLEQMLDKGMNSPATDTTPEEWEQKHLRRIREKQSQSNPQSKAG